MMMRRPSLLTFLSLLLLACSSGSGTDAADATRATAARVLGEGEQQAVVEQSAALHRPEEQSRRELSFNVGFFVFLGR